MVFIIAHYASEKEAHAIEEMFLTQYEQVLLCGSASFAMPIEASIPYHPLMHIAETPSTVGQQHQYIDAMCRAIQIEVPEKIIFYSATLLDTHTVLSRIKEHAGIVGVQIQVMENEDQS
jgi:hypothetical protein